MKSIRVSLLNIVAAGILIWLGMGIIDKTIAGSTAGYTLVLIALILVIDQFFRMTFKSLTRVWLVETIFLILSILAVWIVRTLF